MKVRIITAMTMQEAMLKVKETLGRDAIILHTRKIKKDGVMGLFGKEMVEVTAAVEDDLPKKIPVVPTVPAAPAPVANMAIEQIAPKPESVAKYNTVVPASQAPHANTAQTVVDYVLPQIDPKLQKLAEERSNSDLAKEIAELKAILKDVALNTSKIKVAAENTDSGKKNFIEKYLLDKGLSPALVEYLLQDSELNNKNLEEAKKILLFKLANLIKPVNSSKIKISDESTKIALIGSTGVGKTTTLAKLAAGSIFEKNLKVAFITSDTYRIAAVEQLRTYANILNVPLEVVYNLKDIKAALDKFSNMDIVYIDTAGRSQYNKQQVNELKQTLLENKEIIPYLVINANITYKEAIRVIESFNMPGLENIIFTKLDETCDISVIFNLAYQFAQLKITYITDGQSVPDDIKTVDALSLAKIFLKDQDDE